MESEKARENRLRKEAAQQGYILRKSRTRSPDALDHGKFVILDPETGFPVHAGAEVGRKWIYSFDLDDVESWLNSPEPTIAENDNAPQREVS